MGAPGSTSRRAGVLLALVFLLTVGPWIKHLTAQPAARIALTAAIADRGTIRLDPYEGILGIDRVERDGHLYSDKAPGQPLFAVPFYMAATAVGGHPAEDLGFEGGLVLWWVTFWSCAVPGAALVWMVHRTLTRTHPATALWGAAAVGFGSLVLPFSSELYGHVLATALGFAAWLLVRDGRPTPARLALSGALLGASVVVEYQMALLVAVVVIAAGRRRLADVPWLAFGGAPFAVGLLAYQSAAFGGALRTSYAQKDVHTTAVVGVPKVGQALEVLVGSRGLLVFTPVLLLGLIGLVRLALAAGPSQRDAIVALAVFVGYLALQAGWANPWGGEMPGPRYMIPALPFLGLGVAATWAALPLLSRVLLGVSTLAMLLPVVTLHLVPEGGSTVSSHLRNIDRFGVSPTVWTELLGGFGWAVHVATVGACLVALRSARGEARMRVSR